MIEALCLAASISARIYFASAYRAMPTAGTEYAALLLLLTMLSIL